MSTRAPLDVDRGLAEGFKLQLSLLDEAHKRARTPKERRRIERKIQAVREEIADIIAKGKALDFAFKQWIHGGHKPTEVDVLCPCPGGDVAGNPRPSGVHPVGAEGCTTKTPMKNR